MFSGTAAAGWYSEDVVWATRLVCKLLKQELGGQLVTILQDKAKEVRGCQKRSAGADGQWGQQREQHLQRGDRAGALPAGLPLGPAEEMRAAAGTAEAAGQPRPIGYQPERQRAQLTPWQSGSGAQGPRGTQPQQWRGWQEARGAGRREPTCPPLRRPPPAPLECPG